MRGLSRCFCASPAAATPSLDKLGKLVFNPPKRALPPEVELARQHATAGRDIMKGSEALVNLWREASKPRKGGAILPQPHGAKLDTPELFEQWLTQRDLHDKMERMEDKDGWFRWKYTKDPVVESKANWEPAFHGTWWYAVWLILESGILLESNDRSLGHDFWEPGVYCSPVLDTGLWYARPQLLFGDGVYHRCIFELRVDPARRMKSRQRGGVQWVFPGAAISLYAIWIRSNAPPANGEERVNGWEPELEALPAGRDYPPAIVNPRDGAWPEHYDKYAWDVSENNVPPWMRSGTPAPASTMTPAAKHEGHFSAAKAAGSGKRKKEKDSWESWSDPTAALFSWGFETPAGKAAAAKAMMNQLLAQGAWWGMDPAGWGESESWSEEWSEGAKGGKSGPNKWPSSSKTKGPDSMLPKGSLGKKWTPEADSSSLSLSGNIWESNAQKKARQWW